MNKEIKTCDECLPEKDYKQCVFCGKFFINLADHVIKVHGDHGEGLNET